MDLSLSISIHANVAGETAGPENRCEDERIVCLSEEGILLLGTLDGCGGTGAKQYPAAKSWSGARIASHEVGHALQEWFQEKCCQHLLNKPLEELTEDMRAHLSSHLKQIQKLLDYEDADMAVLMSTLSQELPTTLSIMTAEPGKNDLIRVRSYWAGNSRNYMLLPDGLHQISRDDLVGNYDPYEDLTKDGILCNSVNASDPFYITACEKIVKGPLILLSATDGVFSYFDSPIRFEWILLDHLMRTSSPEEWERSLKEEIDEYASDDHTLQLVALNFPDFSTLKEVLRNRWQQLETEYITALNQAFEEKDHERQRDLWLKYKTEYMQ